MIGDRGRPVRAATLTCLLLALGVGGCAVGPGVSLPGTDGPPPIAAPVPRAPDHSSTGGRVPEGPPAGDTAVPGGPPVPGGVAGPGGTTADGAAQPGGEAASVLATLTVRGRGPLTGYSRGRFGQAWTDIEGDGCDQRNQVLARDMTGEVYRRGKRRCIVSTGRLHDPYTGRDIAFRRGNRTSEAVQIDHVVALANAWVSGADRYGPDMLLRLANDPLNLLAVDGRTNQAKGASDAATWLPPNKGFRCAYVSRQIAVKNRYRLSVTPSERAAMERVLAGCAGQLLIVD